VVEDLRFRLGSGVGVLSFVFRASSYCSMACARERVRAKFRV
jgi:hypothetical protein